MKTLASNRDLYEYLQSLSTALAERGAAELREVVTHASKIAVGNGTEFLGESRIALSRLLREERGILTQKEREDALKALNQIDGAFDRRKYLR